MKSGQKILLIVLGAIVALFLGFIIGRSGGADTNATVLETAGAQPITGNLYDAASWQSQYPLQYASYNRTAEIADSPGGIFGGSVLTQHSLRQPEILTNFKGNAFSKDYAEDRGHVYALEDNYNSGRIGEATKGACITCKTPYLEQLVAEYGWDYAAMPFADIQAEVPVEHGTISCANCHDPATMELRVINPGFIEAAERTGIVLAEATTQEMRSYVCAQCHSEYFFEPTTFRIVFPWDNGLDAEDVYSYYQEIPLGFAKDYTQTDSGVDVLKAQHPDYETYITGVHGRAGVACADCHMPYAVENGQKYTSHWVTSPLKTVEASCGQCHDEGAAWLTESVVTIQDNFWQLQHAAGSAVAEAHEAIAAAVAAGASDESLAAPRALVREAQWYWDYVAAENSMGFHNPDQGMSVTGKAIDLALRAKIQALSL